jgi:hypothetical protein
MVIRSGPHGARGAVVPHTTLGNLSISMVPCTTLAKPGIPCTTLAVVISGPNTKGSVRMAKRRFSSCLASDEITTHGYKGLTFAKCTTVKTVVLTVTSGLGSSPV